MQSRSAFVVCTQPNSENKAKAFLTEFGFEVYLPLVHAVVRHARRTSEVVRPFLPRYCFVMDDGNDYHHIRNAPGVSDFVRRGRDVVRVPSSVLDGIHAREGKDGVITLDVAPTGPGFHHGQALRLNMETHGIPALFQHQIGADRAMVFLKILGRLSRSVVPLKDLQAV